MNVCQFGAALIIGILASQSYAGEQQQQDTSSTAIAGTQESVALQTIRWRVAISCYQNSDCAARDTPNANDRGMLRSREPLGESPSTPERRRALGLTKEPINQ